MDDSSGRKKTVLGWGLDQNARAALAIADRGYVLETGRMVLSGTGAQLLADQGVRAAYLGL